MGGGLWGVRPTRITPHGGMENTLPVMSEWVLYGLERDDRRATYVGITTNVKRRLRRHNGELAGGARATRGHAWTLLFVVSGFPDGRTARQYEWRMHRKWEALPPDSPFGSTRAGLRAWRLYHVCTVERVTATAIPNEELDLTIYWNRGSLLFGTAVVCLDAVDLSTMGV